MLEQVGIPQDFFNIIKIDEKVGRIHLGVQGLVTAIFRAEFS